MRWYLETFLALVVALYFIIVYDRSPIFWLLTLTERINVRVRVIFGDFANFFFIKRGFLIRAIFGEI